MYALTAVLSLAALAAATPAKRDAPTLTYPHAGTIWNVGWAHNITWSIPGVTTGTTGSISLAKAGVVDPNPIVSNADVSGGRAVITVPDVTPGSDYSIFVNVPNFGTDFSDPFSITNAGNEDGSATGSSGATAIGTTFSGSVTTTIAFPSTTVVTTISQAPDTSASAASGSASGSSGSASGSAASASASGVIASGSSLVSSASSALSSALSAASSAKSSATAPASSGSSASASATKSAAGPIAKINGAGLAGAAVAALIAVTSGAFML